MSEKFILVSLEDEKAKEIANIVSNDTCRKILDYLGDKDNSETYISKALNMPLSTVHYNMQNLLKHGLVEIKDFVWSDKGNKINVYKVAKKFIVIAPKGKIINDNLKNLLPTVFVSLAASFFIYMFSRLGATPSEIPEQAVQTADIMMKSALSESGALAATSNVTSTVLATAPATIVQSVNNYASLSALWFLFGALFAIIIYYGFSYFRRKK